VKLLEEKNLSEIPFQCGSLLEFQHIIFTLSHISRKDSYILPPSFSRRYGRKILRKWFM